VVKVEEFESRAQHKSVLFPYSLLSTHTKLLILNVPVSLQPLSWLVTVTPVLNRSILIPMIPNTNLALS
jgi:hypothetical protein